MRDGKVHNRFIAVIDIGKSNAKVALVDLDAGLETWVRKIPNTVLTDGPYPHHDVEGIWAFIRQSLREANAQHRLDGISVTTHGAGAALVDAGGDLALPVLDYEYPGPDVYAAEYDAVRPDFSESFTPHLPGGLNLGRQIFWQARAFPEAFARTRWILPLPQYWSYRLSGVPAAEITSLGCHTDLWNFDLDIYSSLVISQGWLSRMPEVRPASDRLGPVLPALAMEMGLEPGVPVYSGIHDSNASLLPHVLTRTPPYSVVSTGTWVIVCSPGGDLAGLDPARDSLANIDALGHRVPTARFMGGREFSMLIAESTPQADYQAARAILDGGPMLLPSVVTGSGPFPERVHRWVGGEATGAPRRVAVSYYLALMTAQCLELTGASGPIVVEGPFGHNPQYLAMLVAATGRPVEPNLSSSTGTAVGAALLARMEISPDAMLPTLPITPPADVDLRTYAARWRRAVG